jgi:hypothetical protein
MPGSDVRAGYPGDVRALGMHRLARHSRHVNICDDKACIATDAYMGRVRSAAKRDIDERD